MSQMLDDDERREARSRSPMRVPAPIVQEVLSTCSLCNHTLLTPHHNTDWNMWMNFGQDQDAIIAATVYLGIFVRWSSVYYSTMGASVPICDACREITYLHLNRIARTEDQNDFRLFRPPLYHLASVNRDLWVAYRIIAKLLASQLRMKMVKLSETVRLIPE
jgi:hypothetical protein